MSSSPVCLDHSAIVTQHEGWDHSFAEVDDCRDKQITAGSNASANLEVIQIMRQYTYDNKTVRLRHITNNIIKSDGVCMCSCSSGVCWYSHATSFSMLIARVRCFGKGISMDSRTLLAHDVASWAL